METTKIKALTSFAGKEGKFREGEVAAVSAPYAKQLIELKLAEESTDEVTQKESKASRATKEDKKTVTTKEAK